MRKVRKCRFTNVVTFSATPVLLLFLLSLYSQSSIVIVHLNIIISVLSSKSCPASYASTSRYVYYDGSSYDSADSIQGWFEFMTLNGFLNLQAS